MSKVVHGLFATPLEEAANDLRHLRIRLLLRQCGLDFFLAKNVFKELRQLINYFEKFSVILLICQNNSKYRDCASYLSLYITMHAKTYSCNIVVYPCDLDGH